MAATDPDAATEDGHPPARDRAGLGTLIALAPYLWPQGRLDLRARVVVAIVFLIGAKVFNVWVPTLFADAVDALDGPQAALAVPAALILTYGLARVMVQALSELRDAVFAKVQQHAVRALALTTFRHLHALSLRFHLERRTGGLSRVIERGTKGIQFVLSFMLFNILPTILEVLMVGAILAYLFDWRFAVVTVVTISLYIVFTIVVTEWRLKFRRRMNDADTEANTKAIDSLLNFETVKYFGNERYEAVRFDKNLASYETAAVRSQTSLAALNIGQNALIAVGLVGVTLMAAQGVVDGTMTLGDFVLVNSYLIQLYLPLNFLGFVYREVKQSLVDMEKMFELLEVETEIADRPTAKPLWVQNGAVHFEDVRFSYDVRRPVLRGIDIRVPAGRTLAIVGPSGAGKSTISRLLFRFYDATEGRVTIDGQDVRDVTQESLRAAIGMVPQDTVLFNDTLKYNIRYGRPDATDAEVEAAAKLAQIHDFVQGQPDGYDTMVGERGLKLSGGEKQRVAIARTILKDPPILILDEATSALDTHTEKEIQAALNRISRDRTTLIIAHRLSTVIDADEIVVLDKGVIAERGRHGELLAADGLYAALWRRQQEAAEAAEKLAQAQKAEKAVEAGAFEAEVVAP